MGDPSLASQVAPPECSTRLLTLDAGLAQLTVGLAWHFTRYAHEQSTEERERYADAEREARAKRVGLWSDPAPVAPWEWRR